MSDIRTTRTEVLEAREKLQGALADDKLQPQTRRLVREAHGLLDHVSHTLEEIDNDE